MIEIIIIEKTNKTKGIKLDKTNKTQGIKLDKTIKTNKTSVITKPLE